MAYLETRTLATMLARSLKYAIRLRPRIRIAAKARPKPLVSVVIATYNWSSVLRLAIRSVLWQTEQNFEIIVVGDACTDDSEAVVKSFGDPRIRWANLAVNSGAQSAPNNEGIRLGRGRYVTYLGHDDIWHPRHLRSLVCAVRWNRAEVASSLIEMIGPLGSNFRVVAGFYPTMSLQPSGFLHRRDAVERVGGWKDHREIVPTPYVDLVQRLSAAGYRFVSTNELTVFKFNSALRKNSYIEKPCYEQTAYLDRIASDPFFLLKETWQIAQLHRQQVPMQGPDIPPPTPETKGWDVTVYRKIRGLE